MTNVSQQHENPWPHRLAVVTVLAAFSLLWVGALVTTLKAGMAVEDWPSTFGYPWFLYPILDWLRGPRDVFVEHGHRLLGQLVGLLSIALAIVTWRSESRPWVRWLAVATVPAVTLQGVLGGLRVLQNDVFLARLHGCIGPLVFALFVTLAAVTSRFWRQTIPRVRADAGRLQRLALITTLLAYVQLVVGAHLRHITADMTPAVFRIVVFFHLFLALILAGHVGLVVLRAWRFRRDAPRVAAPSIALGVLVIGQFVLGVATWSLKYGWPAWLGEWSFAAGLTVQDGSTAQLLVTTLHVAAGWLIVATALLITLRSYNGLRRPHAATAAQMADRPFATLVPTEVTT
jgi:cytochrome c oxidase assembly protein subunit 15